MKKSRKRFIPRDKRTGRIISRKSYQARLRRVAVRKAERERFVAKLRRKPSQRPHFKRIPQVRQPAKIKMPVAFGGRFTLCNAPGREKFYKKVLADRLDIRNRISDEDYSDLHLTMDIGYDLPKIKKARSRKKGKKFHGGDEEKGMLQMIGFRSFKSVRRLRHFLLPGREYFEEGRAPEWGKKAMCRFKKKAELVLFRLRGRRVIGKTIFKKYELTS